jgi:hypothetical protein
MSSPPHLAQNPQGRGQRVIIHIPGTHFQLPPQADYPPMGEAKEGLTAWLKGWAKVGVSTARGTTPEPMPKLPVLPPTTQPPPYHPTPPSSL